MTVVVAGGSRGIGLELASALAEPGEHVVLGYRSAAQAARTACERLGQQGCVAVAVAVDAGSVQGLAPLFEAARKAGAPVRHVVHSTVEVVQGPLLQMDPASLDHALAVNATSLVWLVAGLRSLMQRGSTVLYVTSRGGRVAVAGYGSVGPAKSLGEGLVRYLAVELAGDGIRVNGLAPGTQDTAALREVFGERTSEVIVAAAANNPSGRLVQPRDYTAMARFLASPEAEMVTGQVMFVHGGADLLG